MPYIKQEIRIVLAYPIEKIIGICDEIFKSGFTGNLNYIIFKLAKHYCHCYSDYAKFIGELECAKNEIERRLLNPYEDKKIEENGDI